MDDMSLIMFGAAGAVGLFGLIIGAVIGFIISDMRSKTPVKTEAQPNGYQSVARWWRSVKSGRLLLELERKYYTASAELTDRQRMELGKLVSETANWLGSDSMPSDALPEPLVGGERPSGRVAVDRMPERIPPAYHLNAQPKTPASPPRQSEGSEGASGLPFSAPPQSEVKPPSLELGDILSRVITPEVPKAPVVIKSIAEQIDEVIQRRLPETAYRGRNIHLRDAPGDGVYVFVDDERYSGVDEVKDAGVREFLHACISEWDRTAGNK